jgi:hypothetical protein
MESVDLWYSLTGFRIIRPLHPTPRWHLKYPWFSPLAKEQPLPILTSCIWLGRSERGSNLRPTDHKARTIPVSHCDWWGYFLSVYFFRYQETYEFIPSLKCDIDYYPLLRTLHFLHYTRNQIPISQHFFFIVNHEYLTSTKNKWSLQHLSRCNCHRWAD